MTGSDGAGAVRRRCPADPPSFLWLVLFFLVPTALVFILAFRPSDPFGGIGRGWTLATLRALADPQYLAIAWRTLWVSFATTAICMLLAVPTGYAVARASARRRNLLLMLVIVPFWTSFLIRVFAWKSILHPEGIIKKALVFLGAGRRQRLPAVQPGRRDPGDGLHLPARSPSCRSTRPRKNSTTG